MLSSSKVHYRLSGAARCGRSSIGSGGRAKLCDVPRAPANPTRPNWPPFYFNQAAHAVAHHARRKLRPANSEHIRRIVAGMIASSQGQLGVSLEFDG